jgi:hypothetical protein
MSCSALTSKLNVHIIVMKVNKRIASKMALGIDGMTKLRSENTIKQQ